MLFRFVLLVLGALPGPGMRTVAKAFRPSIRAAARTRQAVRFVLPAFPNAPLFWQTRTTGRRHFISGIRETG